MAEKKKAAAKKAAGHKETYKIIKKRSGRLSVMDRRSRKFINGAEKVKILVGKGLLKVKIKEAAPAEAAPSEA
jgi:hypothetical protein